MQSANVRVVARVNAFHRLLAPVGFHLEAQPRADSSASAVFTLIGYIIKFGVNSTPNHHTFYDT